MSVKAYDDAHRARCEEDTRSMSAAMAEGSAAVLKKTRAKDGTLRLVVADSVTLAGARAKIEARYAALAAKKIAKLGL